MDAKLALVDSIERVKEKLTSQEYKEILENLAKVNGEKESDAASDLGSDYESEPDYPMPNIEVKVWNGTAVVQQNLRTFHNNSFKLFKISAKLSTFLGIPEADREDTKVYQTDVMKYIIEYVNKHDLRRGRTIDFTKPESESLKTLLRIPEKELENVTFFTLVRHLKCHFISDTLN